MNRKDIERITYHINKFIFFILAFIGFSIPLLLLLVLAVSFIIAGYNTVGLMFIFMMLCTLWLYWSLLADDILDFLQKKGIIE